MNERHDQRQDIEALRARLDGARGQQVLAQPRGAVGDAGVQGVPAPRVPAERIGVARPGRPPRLPEADVGVAGAGRRERLHAPAERGAGAVRAAARRARAGQAALLRDGDAVCGRRRGAAGREPRGPADEDRGQPRSPVEPRRHRHVRAGRRSSASTIRIARPRSPTSARSSRSARSSPRCAACSPSQQAKKGAGLRILTETVASPTLAAQIDDILTRAARGEVGAVGAVRPPQRPRGQPTRV